MKTVMVLFLASFVTVGCQTGVIKDDWTKQLIGKTGYLREPVQIVKDEKKKWAPFADFKRCEPIEIVEARAYGKNTGLVVKQSEKLFYLWSAHDFVNEFKDAPSEAMLNEYMAPTLESALGEKTVVKLTTGTHDSHQLQCQSTYWAGMTAKQLIFVKGRPDQVNKTSTREEWLYKQGTTQEAFDVENGKLVRW